MTTIKKADLIAQLVTAIETECSVLSTSVKSVTDAATNEESKPENQYDTRALEASYLAGAQAERLAELSGVKQSLATMVVKVFAPEDPIAATAVVELMHEDSRSWCFVLPFAAGYKLYCNELEIVTVTTRSPLGRALLGKMASDLITGVGDKEKEYEIIAVK